MAPIDVRHLIAAAHEGDRRSLARLISLVEDDDPAGGEALATLFPATGQAHVIGVTGPPGAGKSTLVDQLVRRLRATGQRVAVLAVDPTSPFTGGAILGDRIRMQQHSADPGVYIRSMGSRGQLGGVSAATPKAIALLDSLGYPLVMVETVGVGQAEVEIAESADTTVVVLNPGWGDSVQAAKAGLLEAGDVFVINKADRPGVDETTQDLRQMLELGEQRGWVPSVVATVATSGEGIAQLAAAISGHWAHLERSGELEVRRRRHLAAELRRAVLDEMVRRASRSTEGGVPGDLSDAVAGRRIDPWSAARHWLDGPP